MGFANLFNDYNAAQVYQDVIPLIEQPRYGFFALVLAILFLSMSIGVAFSARSIVPKFFLFTILSLFASLFCGIATVFISNSFGVYV
ncbi:hypothetical protein KAFR_0J02750 [Kazachstania africana CBS 2517]|uniref:Dolichyl-diphosphooligosaccharide-protein glycosyltransferase subunit OST5 n=1 Tax=Kazachstania africana (strain ATCC 22294 / BCRC 22015 / CBS 2517 / CECT 1963 / NBRC 1671 / NRRL Y-8276) TaxID=1071382 RepID=H2B139_KAZAF|nr:hypothetical protein KAFR_0J02750 [Kazachstania africana CBS 2517]CCF60339.1 hypothetical protein KAFR_0J02750 [Kazachstania africana CBS 2517]